MYRAPLSASSILNDSRSESAAIPWNQSWTASLSLPQNQLSCSFLARHSLAPFPFSVALFVRYWNCISYFGNGEGVEVHLWELYFRHTGEGTRIHSSFVTGGYFQSWSHDMTISTHAHPYWHQPMYYQPDWSQTTCTWMCLNFKQNLKGEMRSLTKLPAALFLLC